jgi:hypothetical protein
MAARAAQKAEILSAARALAFIKRHGIVCEAARRPTIPSLVEAIIGSTVRGNWWSHPRGREIFAITRAMRAAPDVLTCRIVDARISFVHARLWAALVRAADHFPRKHLARIREIHSASGRHVIEEVVFPDWVPQEVKVTAARMSEAAALTSLAPLAPR